MLVLENLTYVRENMDYGAFMNRRLHGWGFARMYAQLRYKAVENGIRVETVNHLAVQLHDEIVQLTRTRDCLCE